MPTLSGSMDLSPLNSSKPQPKVLECHKDIELILWWVFSGILLPSFVIYRLKWLIILCIASSELPNTVVIMELYMVGSVTTLILAVTGSEDFFLIVLHSMFWWYVSKPNIKFQCTNICQYLLRMGSIKYALVFCVMEACTIKSNLIVFRHSYCTHYHGY